MRSDATVHCLISGSLRGLIPVNRCTRSCIWTALLHLASHSCSTPLRVGDLSFEVLAVVSSLFALQATALAFQMSLRVVVDVKCILKGKYNFYPFGVVERFARLFFMYGN